VPKRVPMIKEARKSLQTKAHAATIKILKKMEAVWGGGPRDSFLRLNGGGGKVGTTQKKDPAGSEGEKGLNQDT